MIFKNGLGDDAPFRFIWKSSKNEQVNPLTTDVGIFFKGVKIY